MPGQVQNRWRLLRVVLVLVGLVATLVGLGAVVWEGTEYGPGLNFSIEERPLIDRAIVRDPDEGSAVVFEGTMAEAEEYLPARSDEAREYTFPIVLIAIGAFLTLFGVFAPHRSLKASMSQLETIRKRAE